MLLLPRLHLTGNSGGARVIAQQQRFVTRPEDLLGLIQCLRNGSRPTISVGLALHSLRAVPLQMLVEVVREYTRMAPSGPIHLHIAEQEREVADCLQSLGKRPVQALLDTGMVDARWCLVHSTHITPSELRGIVECRAVVGLCLTTEANLGDGVFPLQSFVRAGGSFGIGSGSQICIDPGEELRWLEYEQRLASRQRVIAHAPDQPHSGLYRYGSSIRGGHQALGLPVVDGLRRGGPADIVVLEIDGESTVALRDEQLLDAHVFASRASAVREVMVGGEWIVQAGRPVLEDSIRARYRESMRATART